MRSVLLIAHTSRHPITLLAHQVTGRLRAAGFEVRMLADEATACSGVEVTTVAHSGAAGGTELVLVLGGDGTFLRAAEIARPAGVPMLGVNLGHVGFLAEAEPDALLSTVEAIAQGDYTVDDRVTVDAEVLVDGELRSSAWDEPRADARGGGRRRRPPAAALRL
jgi:NAD+ kinase